MNKKIPHTIIIIALVTGYILKNKNFIINFYDIYVLIYYSFIFYTLAIFIFLYVIIRYLKSKLNNK